MRAALEGLVTDCARGGNGPCPIIAAFSITEQGKPQSVGGFDDIATDIW